MKLRTYTNNKIYSHKNWAEMYISFQCFILCLIKWLYQKPVSGMLLWHVVNLVAMLNISMPKSYHEEEWSDSKLHTLGRQNMNILKFVVYVVLYW